MVLINRVSSTLKFYTIPSMIFSQPQNLMIFIPLIISLIFLPRLSAVVIRSELVFLNNELIHPWRPSPTKSTASIITTTQETSIMQRMMNPTISKGLKMI